MVNQKNLVIHVYFVESQFIVEIDYPADTLILHEPSETIRGVVESVQYPIIEDGNLGSVTQYCIVRVRGVRAETTTTSISRILGIGRLAVSNLG